jgi:hypothetical protein
VRKCSASSAQFADITRDIRFKSHGGGQSQSLSLEDLLHKPVARVQKNALVLHVSTKMSFVYIYQGWPTGPLSGAAFQKATMSKSHVLSAKIH